MTIHAELHPYAHAFRVPLRTAVGTYTERRGWLLTLSRGGHSGVGEAAPLPPFSTETHEQAGAALTAWCRTLDPAQLPSLPSARHGVHQALLALRAAEQGASVASLLSPSPAPSVPLNALVSSPEQARRAVDEGFATVKVKVALGQLQGDLALVAAVRHAIGPHVALRLDANGRWSVAEAQRALEQLAPFSPSMVEQPVATWDDLHKLQSPVPIAVDEGFRTADDLARALACDVVAGVVLKPMLLGGIDRCVALGERALAGGLAVWITSTLDGAVARRGAFAAARALPGLRACGLATGNLLATDHGTDFTIRHGRAWP